MVASLVTCVLGSVHGEVAVKSRQKIAFLGDSITAQGAQPNGYVRLVISGLDANGVHMNPLGNQMMATGVLEAFGLDATPIAKAR